MRFTFSPVSQEECQDYFGPCGVISFNLYRDNHIVKGCLSNPDYFRKSLQLLSWFPLALYCSGRELMPCNRHCNTCYSSCGPLVCTDGRDPCRIVLIRCFATGTYFCFSDNEVGCWFCLRYPAELLCRTAVVPPLVPFTLVLFPRKATDELVLNPDVCRNIAKENSFQSYPGKL